MSSSKLLARDALVNKRHRVEGLIGEGGLSRVYAAHDQHLNLRVGLKVLNDEGLVDAGMIERFLREGRLVVRLDSPHIAKAYDFGFCEELGVMYIALERLHGADLEHVLADDGPLPVALAVDYAMQALAGVAAAHVEGIVHRDLKPANLFLAEHPGRPPIVKVLDFGIAKALRGPELGRALPTSSLDIFGTPLYMAPEQLQSAKGIDERADIWSIGVILYELLTGATPFVGASLGSLLTAILDGHAAPLARHCPDVSPALAAVVHRCMNRDRAHRFPSVMELGFGLAPFGSAIAAQALADIERIYRSGSHAVNPNELAVIRPSYGVPSDASTLVDALPRLAHDDDDDDDDVVEAAAEAGAEEAEEDEDAETVLKRHVEEDDEETALKRHVEEDDDEETALKRQDVIPDLSDDSEGSQMFELIKEEMIAQPAARGTRGGAVVPAPRRSPAEPRKDAGDHEVMRLRHALEQIASAADHLGAASLRQIAREALDRKR